MYKLQFQQLLSSKEVSLQQTVLQAMTAVEVKLKYIQPSQRTTGAEKDAISRGSTLPQLILMYVV